MSDESRIPAAGQQWVRRRDGVSFEVLKVDRSFELYVQLRRLDGDHHPKHWIQASGLLRKYDPVTVYEHEERP